MRRAVALLTALLFSGCASMQPWEQAYLGASAADLATTAIGLQRGLEEQNPILRGSSDGETLARALVLNGLVYWAMRSYLNKFTPPTQDRHWRVVFFIRVPVVAWNANQIAGAD
jgi:hypothetical protein